MPDRLLPEERLHPGEALYSENSLFALSMQPDGNLVLYWDGTTNAIWASETLSHDVAYAVLQADGNFVIYEASGAPLFATGTDGEAVEAVVVDNSGRVILYGPAGEVRWVRPLRAQPGIPGLPTDLYPPDGAVVTAPPSFSWTPGRNNAAIYLNVSTDPSGRPVDAVNWVDDGTHYYAPDDVGAFERLRGRRLYWRLAADNNGIRAWTPVRSFVVGETSVDPFYNLLHLGWPSASPPWDPFDLDTVRPEVLTSYVRQVGSVGARTDRKLGCSFHVPYFFVDNPDHFRQLVVRVLEAAEAADVPILVGLDGYEYWGGRPDLWNWWDASRPGYDPDNRLNVEWTGWGPEHAVRDGGIRNWGSPDPVAEPHPNLTSPRVLEANREALRRLAPVIARWHDRLPESRKYLLAGVKVGWEVSVGVNYDYGRPVGYAAATTAGIRTSGALTREDNTRSVQIYLTELSRVVHEAGVPRRKIVTHVGVHPRSWCCLASAALTPYSTPGWSIYNDEIAGLDAALEANARGWWGNVEWGKDDLSWARQFRDFEDLQNCKILNRFSFGPTLPSPFRRALTAVVDRRLPWMHPPRLAARVRGRDVTLSWSQPGRAQAVYLNVSSRPGLTLGGTLARREIANERVTGTNRYRIQSLTPGTYHAQVVADGFGRRVASDVVTFRIGPP